MECKRRKYLGADIMQRGADAATVANRMFWRSAITATTTSNATGYS